MIQSEYLGLGLIVLMAGLTGLFAFLGRKREEHNFREIPAFLRLRRSIGQATEAGDELHLSLGRGNIIHSQSAIGFVGLSMLERIAQDTILSDRPIMGTAGEGALAILAQDTLQKTAVNTETEFDRTTGRLTGVTPLSYAAGTLAFIHEEKPGTNVLVGSFGSEIALITEAGERARSLNLAGTDNLTGQAVLFAAAQEPLIGEEAFAGKAYLEPALAHTSSLQAQDVIRWLLIAIMLVGALLKLVGVL